MDDNPKITLDGDVSPFRQKLREATADLKRFGDDGSNAFERMTGPLAALQSKFLAIGALLAGGEVFRQAVQGAAEMTEESVKLGRALGISASSAGILRESLDAGNTSQDEFVGAAKGLAKQLRENEEGLQAMGLKTRDASGSLRPLNELTLDGIKILNDYKSGTDRVIAAQTMFGRGFEMTSNLANMNAAEIKKVEEQMQSLGMVVSAESVAAFEAFDDAGDQAGLTLKAIGTTIGNALMPVLTDLANWFSIVGPAAVTVIRGAIGGLVATFHLLTTGVTVLWETLNALVITFTEPIRAMASALYHVVQGDFVSAAEELRNIPATIGDAWGNAFDKMSEKAESTRDRIWNLFVNGEKIAEPDSAGKGAGNLVKDKKDKKDGAKDQSLMQYYELALAEEKRLASEKDALREYTKQEELSFWQALLQHAALTTKDRVSIEKKAADLTVAIRRAEAKEIQALSAEAIAYNESIAMGRVDAEAAAAQAAVETSQMSKLELAQLEVQFEQRRLEIQRAALQERLALAEQDPNISAVERMRIQHQIEQLQQQHSIRMIQLQSKVSLESNRIWDDLGQSMSSLWDKGVQSLMNGTFRWRSAFKAVGMELVGWFANSVVGEMVKKWLAGEVQKLAIKMGFLSAEKGAQTVASSSIVGIKGAEATGVATANAVEAGTGAAGAVAPTPFIGPMLALAAMATVFAAVSAMGSRVKSASKGYAIPKGLNPMTQLHEEEMVLPSHLSKGIASLIDQGGQGPAGVGGAVNFHVHAIDSAGVERLFRDNGHIMAKELRRQARNFSPTGK